MSTPEVGANGKFAARTIAAMPQRCTLRHLPPTISITHLEAQCDALGARPSFGMRVAALAAGVNVAAPRPSRKPMLDGLPLPRGLGCTRAGECGPFFCNRQKGTRTIRSLVRVKVARLCASLDPVRRGYAT
jgi:hypothetical protein